MSRLGHSVPELGDYVSHKHSGYGCRGGCVAYFHEARLRDWHEELVHRYVHVPEEPPPGFVFNLRKGKRKR